jgi:FkbM family methyltransferase
MHHGQDTVFYLAQGYEVVAIDADPGIAERNRMQFAREVESGQLRILNCAVAAEDGILPFYLSENSVWNSLKKEVSDRKGSFREKIEVEARTLASLLEEFGTPLYAKIDIEGFDAVALRSLIGAAELPAYVSVETECLGQDEVPTEDQILETLLILKELGYRGFKLIDQRSLEALSLHHSPYRPGPFGRLRRRLQKKLGRRRIDRLRREYDSPFPMGASGPFGEEADGEWMPFETAREVILTQRVRFFGRPDVASYLFWCDWHAKW